jgi:NAD+ synthase (glutamine-hydrolysing)
MNPTVGDVAGNAARIMTRLREAKRAKVDVVVFPELAITGYPPEDLLLKPQFLEDARRTLAEVMRACTGLTAVVGCVMEGQMLDRKPNAPMVVPAGRHALYNAAAVLAKGRAMATYCKWFLPNYGVFDESRYFHQGRRIPVMLINGTAVGVNICEDIWFPSGPTRLQAAAGAEVIVNINASPFHVGKSRVREQMLATRARENGVIVTYTNMVGGQDELVFDGHSVIFDHTGELIARGKSFEEDMLVADLDAGAVARSRIAHGRKRLAEGRSPAVVDRVTIEETYRPAGGAMVVPYQVPLSDPIEEVYRALVLGVSDYVGKNGFSRVVIGLSGGIDSALTAAVAVDALGASRVLGVFMPSPYTSRDSHEDVRALADRLGVPLKTVSIAGIFRTFLRTLNPQWAGLASDTTEENLQARIRGTILMAFSNKLGHLVLTTGNKSEMSVGYATLYGDMAGGFAVIKDVPKTMVYELAAYRNRKGGTPVIPKRIMERPPTAELKPDQKDEDTLPPYSILDPILKAYVEEDRAPEDIVDMGFDPDTVSRVVGMVDRSEYKRRQAPIGIKITHRAFGKDRRMPITSRYRSELSTTER